MIDFLMYFVEEKLTQQDHITTQLNQTCSITDRFQIRFRRENNHWKPCNENY